MRDRASSVTANPQKICLFLPHTYLQTCQQKQTPVSEGLERAPGAANPKRVRVHCIHWSRAGWAAGGRGRWFQFNSLKTAGLHALGCAESAAHGGALGSTLFLVLLPRALVTQLENTPKAVRGSKALSLREERTNTHTCPLQSVGRVRHPPTTELASQEPCGEARPRARSGAVQQGLPPGA